MLVYVILTIVSYLVIVREDGGGVHLPSSPVLGGLIYKYNSWENENSPVS